MKVFMPKPGEDWICDVKTDEFYQRTRHQIVNHPRDADVIFLYSKWIWNRIPVGLLQTKKVITTVHHIVPGKQNPMDFMRFDVFTDVYHVPNKHTFSELRAYTQKPIEIIPYWVNDERWKPVNLESSLLEGENRLVLASFQRDTEGASIGKGLIPQPKLEKGPDVFFDIVRRFKKEEVYPFVPGWRRDYLSSSLERAGYDFHTAGKLDDQSMNVCYNMIAQADGVYLVTSRYEGGPQAILEASMTRTKILSTDVGIASTVLHPDCICNSVDEFEQRLRSDLSHTVKYNYQQAQKFTFEHMIPLYDNLIEELG